MTDLPYTRDDLIAEAARQHRILTEDPDFGGVGECMYDTAIDSTVAPASGGDGPTWDESLTEGQYNAAQLEIHDLISRAADTSGWAVVLGADGLTPSPIEISFGHDPDRPYARLQFAFRDDMTEDDQIRFVASVSHLLSGLGE